MNGIKSLLWLTIVLVLTAMTGCQEMGNIPNKNWEELSSEAIIMPESNLPPIGGYLCNSETELQSWLKSDQANLSEKSLDFSKESVAVLIQEWMPYDLKSVTISNKKAKIVLVQYHNETAPTPDVPVGSDIRRIILLKLPKSESIEIIKQEAVR